MSVLFKRGVQFESAWCQSELRRGDESWGAILWRAVEGFFAELSSYSLSSSFSRDIGLVIVLSDDNTVAEELNSHSQES